MTETRLTAVQPQPPVDSHECPSGDPGAQPRPGLSGRLLPHSDRSEPGARASRLGRLQPRTGPRDGVLHRGPEGKTHHFSLLLAAQNIMHTKYRYKVQSELSPELPVWLVVKPVSDEPPLDSGHSTHADGVEILKLDICTKSAKITD